MPEDSTYCEILNMPDGLTYCEILNMPEGSTHCEIYSIYALFVELRVIVWFVAGAVTSWGFGQHDPLLMHRKKKTDNKSSRYLLVHAHPRLALSSPTGYTAY